MSKSFQKTSLFDSEDDSDSEIPPNKIINVDNNYAQKYNDWRRKEVLQKLKDKYGDTLDIMSEIDSDSDKDSDANQEDSDDSEETGESLSDDPFDEEFFNVYGALKNKDPKIYDKNFKFYDTNTNEQDKESEQEEEEEIENVLEKNGKMTLQEYHKKLIKEKKGMTEEDESMIDPKSSLKSFDERKNNPGYYEELYNIRKDIENVLKEDDETDDNDLFSIKDKANINQKVVPHKFENYKQKKEVPNFWSNDSNLDENERFLKKFILNKAYKNNFDDDDDQLDNFDKYKNVANHFKVSEDNNDNIDQCDPSKLIGEKLDISKYHYEEPDATIIKRYPRNISSIRETDNKEKKSKRSEARLRKKQEKEQELKRLRKLKREEIENRIKTLKNAAGIEDLNFKDLDLNVIIDDDNDFDGEKYDRTMKTLFGDDYYNSGNDKKKPTFEFIPGIDDEPINDQIDMMENSNKNNKKKKNKKEIKKQKDIMADDDIGLYEDLIGGEVATRFRYRIVEPNDFGLTDEEILYADDKELNKWCSLKKISQYRSKEKELYDRKVYNEKAKNMALKRKIFKSLYENKQEDDNDELVENSSLNNDYFKGQELVLNDDDDEDGNKSEGSNNQISKKKRRKRNNNNKNNDNDNKIQINNSSDNESIKVQIANNQKLIDISSSNNDNNNDCKKSRKRKRSKNKKNKINNNDNGRQQQISGVSLQRLKAYGISNRELKKMKNK